MWYLLTYRDQRYITDFIPEDEHLTDEAITILQDGGHMVINVSDMSTSAANELIRVHNEALG